jgi:hypothetical protein
MDDLRPDLDFAAGFPIIGRESSEQLNLVKRVFPAV